jgi:hypothetical protein
MSFWGIIQISKISGKNLQKFLRRVILADWRGFDTVSWKLRMFYMSVRSKSEQSIKIRIKIFSFKVLWNSLDNKEIRVPQKILVKSSELCSLMEFLSSDQAGMQYVHDFQETVL